MSFRMNESEMLPWTTGEQAEEVGGSTLEVCGAEPMIARSRFDMYLPAIGTSVVIF